MQSFVAWFTLTVSYEEAVPALFKKYFFSTTFIAICLACSSHKLICQPSRKGLTMSFFTILWCRQALQCCFFGNTIEVSVGVWIVYDQNTLEKYLYIENNIKWSTDYSTFVVQILLKFNFLEIFLKLWRGLLKIWIKSRRIVFNSLQWVLHFRIILF